MLQRLLELIVSRKNEKWLRANGAIEYGQGHYLFIVLLHVAFLLALPVEYYWRGQPSPDLFFLLLCPALTLTKIWTLSFLGKYWNTKIFRIQGFTPVKAGPYQWLRHPNYAIVICEILFIPLSFHLYYTAALFTLLNAIMLMIRIREENRVWRL